ncbi:hypothetical protein CLAFUW4_14120 [Fulvia fulva]|uniref:Uncharacterized protein n=1 Tax=Passalora fulva TaxID=5499 RepID=A0A9Q8PL01_PASFU|nr:uncharacterized protein CLAFUR5_13954 [Fulvia fulva]KAK4610625.1 hypothetical protein CLAFUR4_14123 [Fulvia fulva]KAK4611021.1 hypothetical protein CLAFUR0_14127 [Fulvia fulva]UJO24569.1 hypothetical protein CLAFUR5_13954 [Fulvia fulva]WPV22204.1 hypothetical protein CLAFUW4_14120 [Fulvia fulva]WPV36684.1 hypothetical protein CLAFUW7_14131 [Fulvia fulva]
MRSTLALGLFVASTYAALQLSPIAFKPEDWEAFKNCLGDEIDNYDVTVVEEWINVGPVESRDPDFDGQDAILQKCMIEICSRLQITAGYNEKTSEVLPVSTATEDWLGTSGARSYEAAPVAEDVSAAPNSARDLEIDSMAEHRP